MFRDHILSTSLFALCAALAPPAMAQTAPAAAVATDDKGGFEDIVVTAEKRETNLQKTPIAITALSGASLANQQVQSVADIQGLVPGFQFSATAGFANFTLRGVGLNVLDPLLEGSVAVHSNGVYVSRAQSQLAGFYDVSSIEVLRGPQGTLYGRNATAGSVNINTNMPTENWSGYFNLTAGNYQTINVEAAVSGPITDKLLVRLAGVSRDRKGYGENIVTGNDVDDQHVRGLRATLQFKPSETLTGTLIAEYFREKDNGGGFHYFGAPSYQGLPGQAPRTPFYLTQPNNYINSNILDQTTDIDPSYYLKTVAVTGKLDWEAAEGLTVHSITGYRKQKNDILASDGSGHPTPGYLVYGEPAHQFSEELQVNYVTGPLDLTAGAYYFSERDEANPLTLVENAAQFGGSPAVYLNFFSFPGIINTKSKAAFAQGTFHITDELSVTGGIRYSTEKKRFEQHDNGLSFTQVYVPGRQFPISAIRHSKDNAWTPKLGIQYQATPHVLVYATYAKGFKAGAFDPDTGDVVKPEKLTDYEGGIKTTFLDGRAKLNLAAFYYDYTNLQLQTSNGTNLIIVNAAGAKLYGGEAEFSIKPVRNLQIDLTGAYLHTRYGDYITVDGFRRLLGTVNFKGNQLTNAPKFMGAAAAEYTFDLPQGGLSARGELNYTTRVYLNGNNLDIASQPAYAKVNAFLTYRDNAGWSVGAFLRNATNKITKTSVNSSSGVLNGSISAPRTYGMQAGYKF